MAEVNDDPDLEPILPAMEVAAVSALSVLHGTVAKAMLARITKTGGTAAEWGAINKFLADNNITTKIGQSAELDDLKKRLRERANKDRGRIPADAIAAAEEAMERDIGK